MDGFTLKKVLINKYITPSKTKANNNKIIKLKLITEIS